VGPSGPQAYRTVLQGRRDTPFEKGLHGGFSPPVRDEEETVSHREQLGTAREERLPIPGYRDHQRIGRKDDLL
jgi:hypothetical protein